MINWDAPRKSSVWFGRPIIQLRAALPVCRPILTGTGRGHLGCRTLRAEAGLRTSSPWKILRLAQAVIPMIGDCLASTERYLTPLPHTTCYCQMLCGCWARGKCSIWRSEGHPRQFLEKNNISKWEGSGCSGTVASGVGSTSWAVGSEGILPSCGSVLSPGPDFQMGHL